jgi:dTDP-4-dehydrorhamnose 3,5-epimerase
VIFRETPLAGVVILEPEPQEDERGFFARTWCAREFAAHGLNPRLVQCSISFNKRKGTLRGMHYQAPPAQEAKLVRCTAGAMYDVVIDLRPRSPTRLRHLAVTLSAANHRMLYVPEGFAHGFQTLEDGTEVEYHMTEFHWPECARGVRWNDPAFGIQWPDPHPIILARDRDYPDMLLPGEVKGP